MVAKKVVVNDGKRSVTVHKEVFDDDAIRDAAIWAYENLEGLPEFGEEIRVAIIDTAGDRLYDEGVRDFHERLVEIAKELVG